MIQEQVEKKHGVTLAQAVALIREIAERRHEGVSIVSGYGILLHRLDEQHAAFSALLDWSPEAPDHWSVKDKAAFAADVAAAREVMAKWSS